MQYYKDLGLGGVVTNVAFDRYMESEEHWKTLEAAVDACARLGLVVWLYDEVGYPSGAAGGLVLKEDRRFEALELAYDPARQDPFVLRPSYEHTHATNNYHAARRYVNLLDGDAVRCFIGKTHEAYWGRLEPHFGKTIEAFFTDEPSLMAVNIGQLPENVRAKVRVQDPPDAAVQALARVPWGRDLPELYHRRYGEYLLARRKSLFEGDAEKDRRTRRRLWALVADLVVLRDGPGENRLSYAAIAAGVRPQWRIEPATERVCLGTFRREGRQIVAVVNVGRTPYEGRLAVAQGDGPNTWQAMDPADGTIEPVRPDASGGLALRLGPRKALVLVSRRNP